MRWIKELWLLFFPKRCAACGGVLHSGESVLCVECRNNIPYTFYWTIKENYLTELFSGRFLFHHASALFFYDKQTIWSDMIISMKYFSDYYVAEAMGVIYGKMIQENPFYDQIDLIVPIPLHKKRLRERGYNQAEGFARGIERQTGIKVEPNAVKRAVYTQKQALKKSAQQRWENVENAFEIVNADLLKGKNIMIVDDVITTGATIEACAKAICDAIPDTRFFIGAIACGKRALKYN